MDVPQPAGEPSRILLPAIPPHASIERSPGLDIPGGKRLWTFSLPTFFRPWILGWAVTAAAVMGDDHSRNHQGTVYLVFTWLLFGWTLLALVSSYFNLGDSHYSGWRFDFGICLCTCFGAGDRVDCDDEHHPKPRRVLVQPFVDLAFGIAFMVLPNTIITSSVFRYGDRDFIIVSLFIIA
jgi:hypothetical protein